MARKPKITEDRSEETEGIVPQILNVVTALAAGGAVVLTIVIFGQDAQEQGTEINGWYPLGGGMFVFAVIPWCFSLFFRGLKRVIARTVLTCVFASALPPVAHWLGFLPIGTP